MTRRLSEPAEPAERAERAERTLAPRHRHPTRAALAAISAAAVLLVVRPGSARADAYERAAAAAQELSGDATVREGWTDALRDLDVIPKARRKPMHCYWRSLLLYRLDSPDQADAARIACTGELLRATAPAADKRAEAINNLAREAANAARRSSQALLSQCAEDRQEELAQTSGCQLAREEQEGRIQATTKDLRSLQKRLGDLHLRVRELTSDPQIRKRIESVESLKAVKAQLDRGATP